MSSESPYAPPKSELIETGRDEITRRGRYVVLRPDIEWPSRCFKCNRETDNRKDVRLTYLNPWIIATILINVLITLVLALIFRKRFKVSLPLCKDHAQKRRNFVVFQWASLAFTIVTAALWLLTDSLPLGYVALFTFVVVVLSALFGRIAHAAKFKQGKIWLTGAGREFLDSLPEHGV